MAKYTTRTSGLDPTAMVGILAGPQVQFRVQVESQRAHEVQVDLVPVDTGELLDDLEIRPNPDGISRDVGSFNTTYSAHVEFGHKTKSGTIVPAQPYIRPSVG